MIKFKNTNVWGFEHALRGLRNPMNSWEKSDSYYCKGASSICDTCPYNPGEFEPCYFANRYMDKLFVIGENDMNLAQRLIKGGAEHRKFLRQIFVSVDITAPIYWWKEFDTYKVGTTANSTSTMHKIHAKRFERDDFSIEHLKNCDEEHWMVCMDNIISSLNVAREKYLETKDKKYWWQMIQLLPSSYNQTRTITMTYENLLNMYRQRRNHKLDEWSIGFVDWIKTLPYSEELIMYTGEDE